MADGRKNGFLNSYVGEEIFMDQWEGFTFVGEEQKICRLQRSIYGLKQAFRSWNTHIDEVIWGYDFIKNEHDPYVYKKVSGSLVATLCFMSMTSYSLKMMSRC
ncbi:UNVERIFIED_CONTAM: Retrovirus-related Pol polyprotein from transposon TNT 1-94 [Sesamum radiatum]|uniref:Retrovirus-related Pol polyprotein from transposon TNT 1-94 n=1 Tax=Sesamum radiatum TaxID=300843 RepID=A0AAW2S5U5_SESRA